MSIYLHNVQPQQAFGSNPTSETHLSLALQGAEPRGIDKGKEPFKDKPLVERFFSKLAEILSADLADQVPSGEHFVSSKEGL